MNGMSRRRTESRPPVAARRVGYAVSVLLNAAVLGVFTTWPGWQAAPFLTQEMTVVAPVVAASIAASIVVNALFLVADPPWFTALGGIAATLIGVAALVALWRTFPFAFGEGPVDWDLVARVVLVVGIAGGVVGVAVDVVRLVRGLVPLGGGAPRVAPRV